MTSPIDLPINIVSEIIKNSFDNQVMLSKNTKIAFSRIGGVYILYITNLANEICKSKGRSKITVNDVMEAFKKAGFENFLDELSDICKDNDIKESTEGNKKRKKTEDNHNKMDEEK